MTLSGQLDPVLAENDTAAGRLWDMSAGELNVFPLPFPIKAKYFVIGYALIELFSGLANNPGDNVAHFAHFGRYDIRIHSNNVLEKKGQRKWLLL